MDDVHTKFQKLSYFFTYQEKGLKRFSKLCLGCALHLHLCQMCSNHRSDRRRTNNDNQIYDNNDDNDNDSKVWRIFLELVRRKDDSCTCYNCRPWQEVEARSRWRRSRGFHHQRVSALDHSWNSILKKIFILFFVKM